MVPLQEADDEEDMEDGDCRELCFLGLDSVLFFSGGAYTQGAMFL